MSWKSTIPGLDFLMVLHLVKLCVGAESFEDQQHWTQQRLARMRAAGEEQQLFHTTRMVPKQQEQLLDGGSLYWVIKGQIQGRQQLTDIVPFVDDQGIRRCRLMLGNTLVPTQWQPRRAFQGWRYLKAQEAPPDLDISDDELPMHLRTDLAELGLL